MDLYGTLVNRALFPAWETLVRHRPTIPLQRYLEQTQWRSTDEIEALQTGALRRLLIHAAEHVPHYQRVFAEAGFDPHSVRSTADLLRLPLLTRDEAQASAEQRKSTAPPYPDILKRTSGTSGRPLSFGYDWPSEHWRQAVKLRGYGWAGYRVGVKTLHYWGVHPAPKPPSRAQRAKITTERALKRELYVNCGHRGDEDLDQVVETLRRFRPEVMICYAQAGADLARHVVERGLRDWPDISVLCAAEKVFPADREYLEKAFGPRVFETYGSREVMLMGMECEAHDGLHLSMENLVIEVVVREGSRMRLAGPGEVGEVVVTDLHNLGMPFIRYANGDLARAAEPSPCRCGRGLRKIHDLEGRVSDTLRDARGGRVAGMMFAVFLAHVGQAVKNFQAVQHRDGSLTFRYVPGPEFSDDIGQYLQQSISGYLKGYPVSLQQVEAIPVGENGKRRVVIVES